MFLEKNFSGLVLISTLVLGTVGVAGGCSSDESSSQEGSSGGSGGSGQAGSGGTAGSAGNAQAGQGGSAQAGQGGSAQAGHGGSAQAGQGGSAQAGQGGSAQAGQGGSAQAGQGGSTQAGQGGSAGTAGSGGSSNCKAMKMVKLPEGFSIDSTEVTRCQYKAWLDTHPSTSGQSSECAWNHNFEPSCDWPGDDDLPVTCVDWCDAVAYCEAQGKHLCGSVKGGPSDFYGYNDPNESAWYAACWNGEAADSPPCNAKALGKGHTVPVGSIAKCTTKAKGYEGVYDLIGNVWEWEDSCDDYGSKMGLCHIRGGGFDSPGSQADCSRGEEMYRYKSRNDVGFRCCK